MNKQSKKQTKSINVAEKQNDINDSFESIWDDMYVLYRDKQMKKNDFDSVMVEIDKAEDDNKCVVSVSNFHDWFWLVLIF